jgi:L-alanine-DL-glutamate epimerase-like enolase superfamily enzyme
VVLCGYARDSADVVSDIEHIWQTTWRIGFYRGGPVFMSALSGIDIALWDLKGMSQSNNIAMQVDKEQPGNWEYPSIN